MTDHAKEESKRKSFKNSEAAYHRMMERWLHVTNLPMLAELIDTSGESFCDLSPNMQKAMHIDMVAIFIHCLIRHDIAKKVLRNSIQNN